MPKHKAKPKRINTIITTFVHTVWIATSKTSKHTFQDIYQSSTVDCYVETKISALMGKCFFQSCFARMHLSPSFFGWFFLHRFHGLSLHCLPFMAFTAFMAFMAFQAFSGRASSFNCHVSLTVPFFLKMNSIEKTFRTTLK